MKIWGISDTHFSQNNADTMSYYGSVWVHHKEAIIKHWTECICGEDIVLIGGDITWSYTMKQALGDLEILGHLPGKKKVVIKGNHDVWWKDIKEIRSMMPNNFIALQGDAVKIDDEVICGTTGWVSPNDPSFEPLDRNMFERELSALRQALEKAQEIEPRNGIHVLLHYPPFTSKGHKTPFYDLIVQYPVSTCSYGHFHRPEEWACLPEGKLDGISFHLTATDYLENKPFLIWQS